MAAALIPTILGAIMGSGANPDFDPADPQSRPYRVPKTGMGRFLQRYGGYDPAAANVQFGTQRGLVSQELEGRRSLQELENLSREKIAAGNIASQEQLAAQSDAAARKRMEMESQHRNAMFQAQQMAQNMRDQREREHEAGQYRSRMADQMMMRFGTAVPWEVQDILQRERDLELTAPRAIGSRAVYFPGTQETFEYQESLPATPMMVDPSGEMIPGSPAMQGGFRPFGAPAPAPASAANPPPTSGGGRLTAEELEALSRIASRPPAPAPAPTLLQRLFDSMNIRKQILERSGLNQ